MSVYNFNNNSGSLLRESIGSYGKVSFEREFARRTIANLKYIDDAVEERHARGLTDDKITDVFEVTQLVNSFVGMLIFPKEALLSEVRYNEAFRNSDANKLLEKLSRDSVRFITTYKYTKNGVEYYERLSPKTLARHFRNAVAHNNLSILPKDLYANGHITGIEFSDKSEKGEQFSLMLNIGEIRTLLMALCDLILSKE